MLLPLRSEGRDRDSGFTLLESLVSVGLLALVGVVVLRALSSSATVPTRTLERYWAHELAVSTLEEYTAVYPGLDQDGRAGDFDWVITETDAPDLANTAFDETLALKTITIRVSLEDRVVAELEQTVLRPDQ